MKTWDCVYTTIRNFERLHDEVDGFIAPHIKVIEAIINFLKKLEVVDCRLPDRVVMIHSGVLIEWQESNYQIELEIFNVDCGDLMIREVGSNKSPFFLEIKFE